MKTETSASWPKKENDPLGKRGGGRRVKARGFNLVRRSFFGLKGAKISRSLGSIFQDKECSLGNKTKRLDQRETDASAEGQSS